MAWRDRDLVRARSAKPLQLQIADRLRAGIAVGEFDDRTNFPTEAELVARFKVSRSTARSALLRLADEGTLGALI